MSTPEGPTIYERAGGAEAFQRLCEAFYDRVLADPVLRPLFTHFTEDHVAGVAMWLGEVFGGPRRYSEERGGYPAMVVHHENLALTEEQRARWAALMITTGREVLPADERLQDRFRSYIEWGTHIAMKNSQPDYEPSRDATVPTWDWGRAGPPAGEAS